MSFICGSFKKQEEDDFQVFWPSPPPSRKSRSHKFCCIKNKEYNKNPYSNRGLDKFEALLADIENKKRKIFTQKGSQYISFVRFVYSNSNDVKPIIVWLKDPRRHHGKDHLKQHTHEVTKCSSLPKLQGSLMDHHHHPPPPPPPTPNHHHHHHENSEPPGDVTKGIKMETKGTQHAKSLVNKITKKIRYDHYWKLNLKRKLEELWTPSYNLPLFFILVMLFLTFFGRSLAIICTSIAWYLIPTIDTTLENTNSKPKKMIKSQHSRQPSENKMLSSPKSFYSGPINVKQTNKMKKLMSF